MIAMVAPRVSKDRDNKHKALVHWDQELHKTLSELREALNRIKEIDRDARPHPTDNAG